MPTQEPIYRFDQFEAEPRTGELRLRGERLRLQEQPFQVLIALLERPGDVITRDELRQRLWPSDTFVDFDHGLNTTINKLREVLGDSASNPRFIETLPRRGYRFLGNVQVTRPTALDDSEAPTAEIPAGIAEAAKKKAVAPAAQATVHELPEIPQPRAAVLFLALQLMYLVFYAIALARLDEAGWRMNRYLGVPATSVIATVIVSACVGIALRLYVLTAASFRYRWLGRNFRRIFPIVLIVDLVWAMAPFFLIHLMGIGLAFAACAMLVYAPFAQRVLALLAFPLPANR